MSEYTTWEKHIASSPEKDMLYKHHRDIFYFTNVNLSQKGCINNFKIIFVSFKWNQYTKTPSFSII